MIVDLDNVLFIFLATTGHGLHSCAASCVVLSVVENTPSLPQEFGT